MPALNATHIKFLTDHASINEISATIDQAVQQHDGAAYQWLHDFAAAERASKKRKGVIAQIVRVLKDWPAAEEPPSPISHLPSQPKAKPIDGKAEVVTDPDLPSIRQALEAERDQSIALEERFEQDRLPIFLRMGLQCLKAHAVFAVSADQRQGIGGRGKKTPSTVEGVSEITSFEGWLTTEVRWLPVGSAYRYKRAAQGLGLTFESTPEELAALLQAAREESGVKLSLTLLANRVPPALPDAASDPNTPADKAGEARTQVHDWISRWDRHEKGGGLEAADVETLKQLDEFLTAARDRIRKRIRSATPAKPAKP